MEWTETMLWVLLVLLLIWLWLMGRKPKGLPPGPLGLPLLGYLPFLGELPFVTLTNLGRKYGGVFTLPMLGRHIVVLHDWKSMKEALIHQGDAFMGRPPSIASEIFLKNADVAFTTDLKGWKERRRFTLQQLKEFGFGRKAMEDGIMNEVHQLLKHLRQFDHQMIVIDNLFSFSLMNIIWTVVGGKRFDYGEEAMTEFSKAVDDVAHGLSNESPANVLVALRYLPGMGFHKFQRAYKKVDAFLNREVDEHIMSYQKGHARDFIDTYLSEMDKHKDLADSVGRRSFQRRNLNGVIFDLLVGGIDTGNSTLSWALLYMVTWPEIQQKVQQELDSVVGRARLPAIQDRIMLPYTEAVLLEIHRFATIAPLSGCHYTEAQVELFGYTIPKSTVVFQNIWAVHRDPELWGDPEVFRPERFLSSEGMVKKPKYLIPFSIGGRMCLGEPLARMEMFLYFATLLHQFSFSRVSGHRLPNFKPLVRLTLKPEPFPLTIERR